MPDPWLSEDELEKHNKEVENHPLTKEAEEAKQAAEQLHEEERQKAEENRKGVEEGKLEPMYANGAVVGYRNTEDMPDEPNLGGIKPKAEGRGGATEGELGPVTGSPPASGEGQSSPAVPGEDQTGANREDQKESRAADAENVSGTSEKEAKTSRKGSGSLADKLGKNE